ncbi:hypothetical protein [Streptomyces sp. NPDC059668]
MNSTLSRVEMMLAPQGSAHVFAFDPPDSRWTGRTRGRGPASPPSREGLGWFWRPPVIRFLTLISAADKVRYGAGYLLIITLARQAGASPLWIGVIFSGTAIGAMAGSLVSHRATRRLPLGRIAVVMLWLEALMLPL